MSSSRSPEKTALEEVIKLTGDFKRVSQEPLVIPEEPLQVGPRWVEREFPPAQLTRANVGFPSVSLEDSNLYPLDVLAIILGRGRSSRLYKNVKDEKKLVLSIDSSNWTPHYARGIFIISMALEYANVRGALHAIFHEIEGIQQGLISESELEKAKKQVIADHIFGKQAADDIASSLSSSYVATGDPYFDDHYVKGIQAVTPEDVRRVAREYLRRDRITAALLKPPQQEKASAKELPSRSRSGIEKRVLSNGLTLLLKENPALPIVTLQLFGRGGQRHELPEQPGISLFTMGLLAKGTKTRSKFQIAKEMGELGGSIESSSGRNTYYVSVAVLKEDFEKGLEILSDVVINPSFPEEEIEKQREDTLLAIKRIDESWEREVARLFRQEFFVQHPYRNDLVGTEGSVSLFSRKDLVEFYRRLVIPNNMVLAVFGDIDVNEVARSVKQRFGHLERGDFQPRPGQTGRENQRQIVVGYFRWLQRDDPSRCGPPGLGRNRCYSVGHRVSQRMAPRGPEGRPSEPCLLRPRLSQLWDRWRLLRSNNSDDHGQLSGGFGDHLGKDEKDPGGGGDGRRAGTGQGDDHNDA
jgi:zinc protease